MNFKNVTTKRGGKYSIHKYGNSGVTTNIFGDSWLIITDVFILSDIQKLIIDYNNNPQNILILITNLNVKYNGQIVGVPYRRNSNPSTVKANIPPIPIPTTVNNIINNDEDEIKEETITQNYVIKDYECKRTLAEKLIKFFSEFNFIPAARFCNTLFNYIKDGNKPKDYCTSYFKVCDNPDVDNITEKMKSKEFNEILNLVGVVSSDVNNKINNRLEIYYGPQGTGKTTYVTNKFPDAKVIICNPSMVPSDLMEEFEFDSNGNPKFKPSELQKAMVEGKSIILDEFNLLSMDCLRTLQGYLDNKKIVSFKGKDIEIKDGFKVIGTMNLIVNGSTFGLPEPIVDRAEIIKEVTMTPETLAKLF